MFIYLQWLRLLVRHHKPCGVTPRPGSPEPQPFPQRQRSASASDSAAEFQGGNKVRKPNLWPHLTMACSPLEYAVCWKCGKPSRFDNPHNSNIFFIAGVSYFFLLGVKVLWNSWKCFTEGYLLQCTAILWSSSHRRKTRMYKLCRQKSVKLLRGNSLTMVWKAGSGSSLLRPVTRKH